MYVPRRGREVSESTVEPTTRQDEKSCEVGALFSLSLSYKSHPARLVRPFSEESRARRAVRRFPCPLAIFVCISR